MNQCKGCKTFKKADNCIKCAVDAKEKQEFSDDCIKKINKEHKKTLFDLEVRRIKSKDEILNMIKDGYHLSTLDRIKEVLISRN